MDTFFATKTSSFAHCPPIRWVLKSLATLLRAWEDFRMPLDLGTCRMAKRLVSKVVWL
jgi:hypothetical protein